MGVFMVPQNCVFFPSITQTRALIIIYIIFGKLTVFKWNQRERINIIVVVQCDHSGILGIFIMHVHGRMGFYIFSTLN